MGMVSCDSENILELDRGDSKRLHTFVNVLNTTELYTLKWLIVCYVNFTSTRNKIICALGKSPRKQYSSFHVQCSPEGEVRAWRPSPSPVGMKFQLRIHGH